MPSFSSQGIFLSYRREDAAPYARLLQFQLLERIPDAPVFMDLDSIEPGVDFAEVIRKAIDSCAVLVVLIGPQWASIADEEGRHRLDNPDDFVRFEVQAAFERGVLVIPVLVDGAKPLRQQQLPSELHKLARLNALELSYGRYQYDADRLIDRIQQKLTAAPGTGTVHQRPPTANAETLAVPNHVRPDRSVLGEAVEKDTEPVGADRARAADILTYALRVAQSIAMQDEKARALADIAEVLAPADPDSAARLTADAVRIAQSITHQGTKASALADIARALAATDPDRAARLTADAVRIAQSITDQGTKASALADIARALAATDPDRAARLTADAVRTAESITGQTEKSLVLRDIARALAATDPDRAARLTADAVRVAQSMTDKYSKSCALADLTGVLAATDPDRAEHIAQSITDGQSKARALADLTGVLAATDPDRAEHIAQSITDQQSKARALAQTAEALAATDPDRAARLAADTERIAQFTTDQGVQACALAYAAGVLAATDPDRAARLAADAERLAQSIPYKKWRPKASMAFIASEQRKTNALEGVACLLAATDPDRAERIAQSITTSHYSQARALVKIATMLAATDPDRAYRIAQSILDHTRQAKVLVIIADKLQLGGHGAI